jgi:ubiquinone/menaquinone biosynthesis C-methylase UbiE
MNTTPENIQKEYYEKTAAQYDSMHVTHADQEHQIALEIMGAYLRYYRITSILDIGAGTGRTINYIKSHFPTIKIIGIEPVEGLRKQGHSKGIFESELIDGNGEKLTYPNDSFDLVCEFGVLHHVPHPEKVVAEMIRVAKKGVFISDSNNFGQGGNMARCIKQTINFFGLWRAYNFIRTKGKVYQISEADGLFYSYSVFNNYHQIKDSCDVFITNITPSNKNPYKSAAHIALFGKKK